MRWRNIRIAAEALTLVVLVLPPVWLALRWPSIPAVSPHLHHSRLSLWVMPTYAFLVYLALSEGGLLSKTAILRQGHRLSGLRTKFTAYLLTVRLEALVLFAVLSLAMDQTAVTGHVWFAKGFIAASLTAIVLTILMFVVTITPSSYRMARSRA